MGRKKEEGGGGDKKGPEFRRVLLMADGEADEGCLLQHGEEIGTRVHALDPTKGTSSADY